MHVGRLPGASLQDEFYPQASISIEGPSYLPDAWVGFRKFRYIFLRGSYHADFKYFLCAHAFTQSVDPICFYREGYTGTRSKVIYSQNPVDIPRSAVWGA